MDTRVAGCNDFRGVSFHAAHWDPHFDPAGKRVAVIGTDATAGHYLDRLNNPRPRSPSSRIPPRRFVAEVSLPYHPGQTLAAPPHRHPGATSGRGPVVARRSRRLTASGIRTSDGVDHRVDAIIYGTGFTIPDPIPDETLVGAGGLTIRQAWYDGMEPFLGVAVHGFPNYFLITGPDVEAQHATSSSASGDESDRQHPHRGAPQQPAGVQRARPPATRPQPPPGVVGVRPVDPGHRRATRPTTARQR